MIKPTDPEKLLKLKKKRGNYFHNAVHKPMAGKYNVTLECIQDLRLFAIHKNMSQKDICLYIIDKLNRGIYDSNKRGRMAKPIREEMLKLLLHITPEQFDEITRKTKFDWD